MTAAVEVRNLTKVYRSGGVTANAGLSFSVDKGQTFGLLGPNGAGKSTAVKQIVGLVAPTSGSVHVFGRPVIAGRDGDGSPSRSVAYLPQGLPALGELTVGEAVRWAGVLRGSARERASREGSALLDALDLGAIADRQLRRLSGGQRRLAQIAMTLAGRLPILIFDEPTADIDPRLKQTIWEMIAERVATGVAAVLVTHDVAEAEHVLDRVAILDRGRIVASGTPAELKARHADRARLEVTVAEGSPLTPEDVARTLGGGALARGRRVDAWVSTREAAQVLDAVVATIGLAHFEDVRLITPTLEDVYLELSEPMPTGVGATA